MVTEGNSNIVISVPGDNGDQARQLGQTAQLRFRPVDPGPRAGHAGRRAAARPRRPTDGATPTATPRPPTADRRRRRPRPAPRRAGDRDRLRRCRARPWHRTRPRSPRSRRRRPVRDAHLRQDGARHGRPARGLRRRLQRRTARPSTCSGPAVVEGTDVTDATAGTRSSTGEWIVQLDFNSKRLRRTWAKYTGRQRRQAGRASPSTAGSSPRRRSTARSPAARPRSPAASPRRRPPSWPTSSSTARCR